MKQKIYFILILLLIPALVLAYPFTYDTCNLGYTHVHHKHNEASYQDAWCSIHSGVTEYENKISSFDVTRIQQEYYERFRLIDTSNIYLANKINLPLFTVIPTLFIRSTAYKILKILKEYLK